MSKSDQSSPGEISPAVSKWWMVLVISLLLPENSSATVNKPPQIVKDLNQQMPLKVGTINRFVLECRGDGDPAPTYRWFRNSQLLTSELLAQQDIEEMSDGEHSELHFTSPTVDHEGYYHCEAENSLGRARSSNTLVAPTFPSSPPGTSPPHFIEAPRTELQSLGSKVELVCKASGDPSPDITWTKNGKILNTKTDTLVIPSLGQEDVANYACNASNIAGYEYKNVILSILTMRPRIKEGPKDYHAGSKGSNITLKCEAEGYPQPVITWTRDGQPVVEGQRFHVDPQTGDLTVTQASTKDDGRYECRAKSISGEDTAAGDLEILSKTTIIDGPKDVTETVEDTIVMKCEVVADLSLDMDVTWKKDNLDFEENARIQQNEDHSLTIKNLTFDDSGLYTCVATTSLNRASETGRLTVKGVEPQLVRVTPDFQTFLEGDSLRIPCKLKEGVVPSPSVIWYWNDEEVDRSRVREEDNTLELGPLTTEDSGEYICQATNREGKDIITVEVVVSERTKVLSLPRDVDLEAQYGRDVFFPCEVSVDSNAVANWKVNWYKDSVKLDAYQIQPYVFGGETIDKGSEESAGVCDNTEQHRLYLLLNDTLVVCGLTEEDLGSYHCEVSTELEQSIMSQLHSVYIGTNFPWWIILVIIIALLLLLVFLALACYWRRKTQGKGYYGMDVEDGGVRNKSDIYYTTEDNESIMDEMDQSMLDKQNGKTPIFTPKTIRRLARVDKSIGSIGSLLDDDEYLDKGYDEDGSFRERYAE